MYHRAIFGLTLMLLLNLGTDSLAQKVYVDLEQQYQIGLKLMRAGQYERAVDPLYECYREDSKNLDLANQVAYCYVMTGKYQEAKYAYQSILKQDSTNLSAISNLAMIHERTSNYRQARIYYLQLLDIDTTNSYYFKQNAAIALKTGDLLSAGAYYNRAHQLNPEDITVAYNLAQIYLDFGAAEFADTFAYRAIRLDSLNIRALQTFAKVKHALKQYDGVILPIRKCMQLGDSTIFYQKMLANALLRSDSLDAAIDRLKFIIKRKKASEYTFHNLAVAYELKTMPDSAAIYYEAAIEDAISKQYPEYCRSLAEIYEKQGEYKRAIELFQEAYTHASSPDLIFHLARNYELYYKDKQMAIRQYQRYLASSDQKYRDYSTERLRLLKELVHQQKR